MGGAALELAVSEAMKRRLGGLAEPYGRDEAGRYERLATGLTAAGTVLAALAGRSRLAAALGGALVLGG
ncbi:hypothetical protein WAJ69_21145, partial [Acinetobacter baumannii]